MVLREQMGVGGGKSGERALGNTDQLRGLFQVMGEKSKHK
jgi:hypothetical protein